MKTVNKVVSPLSSICLEIGGFQSSNTQKKPKESQMQENGFGIYWKNSFCPLFYLFLSS